MLQCLPLLFLPLALASTVTYRDPCKCSDLSKYEAPYIWDRTNCCTPWTIRAATEEFATVDRVVYQRVAGTVTYARYSDIAAMPQVDFPGSDAVLHDPNNTYTNLTCRDFACALVTVYRHGANSCPVDDECLALEEAPDVQAPLCHNSSADKCVIWVPQPALTGAPWLVPLVVVLSVGGVFACVYQLCGETLDGGHVVLWVYVFVLSEVAVPVVCFFDEWLARLEVDLDYVTYQTCVRECAMEADDYQKLAQLNQCADRGVSCDGIPTSDRLLPCTGCQAHARDWEFLLRYVTFVKSMLLAHWLVIIYLAKFHRACCPVFLACLGMSIAWIVLVSVRLRWCGTYGLTALSSPYKAHSLWDLGMAWAVCGIVWSMGFGLRTAKKQAEREGNDHPHAQLVFSRVEPPQVCRAVV